MKRVLSTKVLSQPQKELLLNAGIGFVDYDTISISYNSIEKGEIHKSIIATSQNAVISLIQNNIFTSLKKKDWFCVGQKTSALLLKHGVKSIEMGYNSGDLAKKIVKNHKDRQFTFFAGDKRRDELPLALKENNILYNEYEVYKNVQNRRLIRGDFDGIMFFSPSSLKSYVLKNTIGDSTAFCIGKTTAEEAKKYTDKLVIANKPTIENVLVQVIKKYK
jgi:uroporphyrinogen-III synthase